MDFYLPELTLLLMLLFAGVQHAGLQVKGKPRPGSHSVNVCHQHTCSTLSPLDCNLIIWSEFKRHHLNNDYIYLADNLALPTGTREQLLFDSLPRKNRSGVCCHNLWQKNSCNIKMPNSSFQKKLRKILLIPTCLFSCWVGITHSEYDLCNDIKSVKAGSISVISQHWTECVVRDRVHTFVKKQKSKRFLSSWFIWTRKTTYYSKKTV